MSTSLQREANKTRRLLTRFKFSSIVEDEIELLKLLMIQKPIEIQICGMFNLDYFILYAVS